nr:YtxH domain-containing protein [uncultured Bacteroides sp.]
MKCKDSNFWIGLGIGSVVGALVYHFSRTEKAKRLEHAVHNALHKVKGEAKEFIDDAEEKAMHVSEKVADKVAYEAHEAAEKADNLKNKVHNLADNAKK